MSSYNRPLLWNSREDDLLRRAFEDGHSDDVIAKMLSYGTVERTRQGVRKRRQKLCLLRTESAIEDRKQKDIERAERAKRIMGSLTPDAKPLEATPQPKEVVSCNLLVALCMREARAAGAQIDTVGDLRAYYVPRFELDILPGHPKDVPISLSDRASMVGSQF